MHDFRCVWNEEMTFNDIIANKSSLAMIILCKILLGEEAFWIKIISFLPN